VSSCLSKHGVFTVDHPQLHVPICRDCLFRYNGLDWGVDDDKDGKDAYCQWCADGGDTLYPCDRDGCHYCWCKECLEQNVPGSMPAGNDSQENWECVLCSDEGIRELGKLQSATQRARLQAADLGGGPPAKPRQMPLRPAPSAATSTAIAPRNAYIAPAVSTPGGGGVGRPPSEQVQCAVDAGASERAAAPAKGWPCQFGDCAACGTKGCEVEPHPRLRAVSLCTECCRGYREADRKGHFMPDGEGCEVVCHWCADDEGVATRRAAVSSQRGGRSSPPAGAAAHRVQRAQQIERLLPCAECPAAFCIDCLHLNLDSATVVAIQTERKKKVWRCFVCNPSALPEATADVVIGSHADVMVYRRPQARAPLRFDPAFARDQEQPPASPAKRRRPAAAEPAYEGAELKRGDMTLAFDIDGSFYFAKVREVREVTLEQLDVKYEYLVTYVGWKEQHTTWAVVEGGGLPQVDRAVLHPKKKNHPTLKVTVQEGVQKIEAAASTYIQSLEDYTQWEGRTCSCRGKQGNFEVVESGMLAPDDTAIYDLYHWVRDENWASLGRDEDQGDWCPHKNVKFNDDGGVGTTGAEVTEVMLGRHRLLRADKCKEKESDEDLDALGAAAGIRSAAPVDAETNLPALADVFLPLQLSPPARPDAAAAAGVGATVARRDSIVLGGAPVLRDEGDQASSARLRLVSLWRDLCEAAAAALLRSRPEAQPALDGREKLQLKVGRTAAGLEVLVATAATFGSRRGGRLQPLDCCLGVVSVAPDGGSVRAAVYGLVAAETRPLTAGRQLGALLPGVLAAGGALQLDEGGRRWVGKGASGEFWLELQEGAVAGGRACWVCQASGLPAPAAGPAAGFFPPAVAAADMLQMAAGRIFLREPAEGGHGQLYIDGLLQSPPQPPLAHTVDLACGSAAARRRLEERPAGDALRPLGAAVGELWAQAAAESGASADTYYGLLKAQPEGLECEAAWRLGGRLPLPAAHAALANCFTRRHPSGYPVRGSGAGSVAEELSALGREAVPVRRGGGAAISSAAAVLSRRAATGQPPARGGAAPGGGQPPAVVAAGPGGARGAILAQPGHAHSHSAPSAEPTTGCARVSVRRAPCGQAHRPGGGCGDWCRRRRGCRELAARAGRRAHGHGDAAGRRATPSGSSEVAGGAGERQPVRRPRPLLRVPLAEARIRALRHAAGLAAGPPHRRD
jgi:hypothetical protein